MGTRRGQSHLFTRARLGLAAAGRRLCIYRTGGGSYFLGPSRIAANGLLQDTGLDSGQVPLPTAAAVLSMLIACGVYVLVNIKI